MGWRNNKKRRGNRPLSLQQDYKTDDYNLENSFNKIRQYNKKYNRSSSVTEQFVNKEGQSHLVNPNQILFNGPTVSDSWSQYTHLEDKISNIQTQNENAHTQLRKELSDKIDKLISELRNDINTKLSKKWYSWTIGAIVAFVSLIYLLSYSRVLSKQEEHTKEIQELEIQIKDIENNENHLKGRVDVLEDSKEDNKEIKD